ncbi:MAG: DUF192 domain-containing protein [Candidatus Altiarchaeota archaeon]
MQKRFILAIFIFFLILALFLLPKKENSNNERVQICFDNTCIYAEVAMTDEKKRVGLMYRENLDSESGMLFPYKNEVIPAFWMKNMNFPIDIIWIDKHKRIFYIHQNVQPCRAEICEVYTPEKPIMYVLEVNANFSYENNLTIGKEVKFNLNPP